MTRSIFLRSVLMSPRHPPVFPVIARIVARRQKPPHLPLQLQRPFGPGIHVHWRSYLKSFHALSYERLSGAFKDIFGLNVSEGAIMNMFARSRPSSSTPPHKPPRPAFGPPALSPATKPVFVSRAQTLSTGYFIARMPLSTSPIYSRAARVVHEDHGRPCARGLDYLIGIQPSNLTAIDIKPALHIWRVIQPLRWSMGEDDLPFRFRLLVWPCVLISPEP